ncbi:MAG: hypothetical protein JSR59_07025 [Proteobacteria bacterium]|nr:hypothetical protein [Pseudomonadota bacterium]
MPTPPQAIAQLRLANALALFDEFVQANVRSADAATLRGLEGRFAERLQIQASYWSQIKSRARHIGDRLARQFEALCGKPEGWMDEFHGAAPPAPTPQRARDEPAISAPRDDDERFIVGLVLTYYRRHPERARARLLDLLGEVLNPPQATPARPSARQPAAGLETEHDLWTRTQAAVAPIKRKR